MTAITVAQISQQQHCRIEQPYQLLKQLIPDLNVSAPKSFSRGYTGLPCKHHINYRHILFQEGGFSVARIIHPCDPCS
jgi:hypothetical protein